MRDLIQRAFFSRAIQDSASSPNARGLFKDFLIEKAGKNPPNLISVSHFCVILSEAKDLARSASRHANMARARKIPPLHPGEVLYEDFIVPTGISIHIHRLAMDLRVPANRIAEIVKGARRMICVAPKRTP